MRSRYSPDRAVRLAERFARRARGEVEKCPASSARAAAGRSKARRATWCSAGRARRRFRAWVESSSFTRGAAQAAADRRGGRRARLGAAELGGGSWRWIGGGSRAVDAETAGVRGQPAGTRGGRGRRRCATACVRTPRRPAEKEDRARPSTTRHPGGPASTGSCSRAGTAATSSGWRRSCASSPRSGGETRAARGDCASRPATRCTSRRSIPRRARRSSSVPTASSAALNAPSHTARRCPSPTGGGSAAVGLLVGRHLSVDALHGDRLAPTGSLVRGHRPARQVEISSTRRGADRRG